jgi:ribosomal protein L6P/L9E
MKIKKNIEDIMANITIKRIEVECNLGSNIVDCIDEAMKLAIEENTKVVLKGNDKQYVLDWPLMFGDILKESCDEEEV